MTRIWNKYKPSNILSKRKAKSAVADRPTPKGFRVFVGMSGGVDSSVSAALLKQATPNNFEKLFGRPTPKGFRGFAITGVFIKVWEPPNFLCTWRDDRREAMRVAALLDIPFITIDLSKEYKRSVVDYMIAEYKAGRTPNPDVMCNKSIKFGEFYKRASRAGADYVATGHYAQIKKDSQNNRALVVSKDKEKDQTYFLWSLTEDHLSHTIFPIGHLTKPEVRKLARKFKLPNAEKKDSQGLCFIGKLDITDFLKNYIKEKKGKVLNEKGEVIGHHEGVYFYTIDQRHGFIITKKTTNDEPYYVIAKDLKKNTLMVSTNPKLTIQKNNVAKLEKVNWINAIPKSNKKYGARIRYRQKLESCQIKRMDNSPAGEWQVNFLKNQSALPAGQSLVVYDAEICLGGGILTI